MDKKFKNRIIYLIMFFSLFKFSTFTTEVNAATLGSLVYWESTGDLIGRWAFTPRVYVQTLDSSLSHSSLASYTSHARSQWSGAGIGTLTTDFRSNANIRVYGGTYNSIKEVAPAINIGATGFAVVNTPYEGDWIANGRLRSGRRVTGADIYIVHRSNATTAQYRNTTTHELGHGLGWLGHSANTSDIMRASASSITTLSVRDRRHLNQIY